MSDAVETAAYIIIEPTHAYDGRVISVRAVKMTKTPPDLLQSQIAVRLLFKIDRNVFEQFLPTIEVNLSDPRQFTLPDVDVIVPEQEAAEV